MTTTITIANTTIGASRQISITDADTALLATALKAIRYGDAMTNAQAIMQALGDWVGDLKALVIAYQQQTAATTGINPTG